MYCDVPHGWMQAQQTSVVDCSGALMRAAVLSANLSVMGRQWFCGAVTDVCNTADSCTDTALLGIDCREGCRCCSSVYWAASALGFY